MDVATHRYIPDVFDAILKCSSDIFILCQTQKLNDSLTLTKGTKITERSKKPQSTEIYLYRLQLSDCSDYYGDEN